MRMMTKCNSGRCLIIPSFLLHLIILIMCILVSFLIPGSKETTTYASAEAIFDPKTSEEETSNRPSITSDHQVQHGDEDSRMMIGLPGNGLHFLAKRSGMSHLLHSYQPVLSYSYSTSPSFSHHNWPSLMRKSSSQSPVIHTRLLSCLSLLFINGHFFFHQKVNFSLTHTS